ncbi:MAG: mersacidin/lichenicidin family type 2 lantibiotic, partial [Ktedonobacteraceae bacterium]|nr:mersacidin/lichenicidin family type 2 lantibiotic [Ktedonobacteraceae bacterium]
AWKDEVYRENLSEEQLAQLPACLVGAIDLGGDKLDAVLGAILGTLPNRVRSSYDPPHLHTTIHSARGDACAIGRPGECRDIAGVAAIDVGHALVDDMPDLHCFVVATDGELLSAG